MKPKLSVGDIVCMVNCQSWGPADRSAYQHLIGKMFKIKAVKTGSWPYVLDLSHIQFRYANMWNDDDELELVFSV